MKTYILLIAFGITLNVTAQTVKETDVPPAAKAAFMKLYPTAKVEKWEKEDGNYEAEFDNNKVETSVLLSEGGTLLETETEMKTSELPKTVTEYVDKYLNGKKIKEASKIVYPQGKIGFEAEVDGIDYIFDENGTFVKKDIENDKEIDDKE
jgi:hypothetical protein